MLDNQIAIAPFSTETRTTNLIQTLTDNRRTQATVNNKPRDPVQPRPPSFFSQLRNSPAKSRSFRHCSLLVHKQPITLASGRLAIALVAQIVRFGFCCCCCCCCCAASPSYGPDWRQTFRNAKMLLLRLLRFGSLRLALGSLLHTACKSHPVAAGVVVVVAAAETTVIVAFLLYFYSCQGSGRCLLRAVFYLCSLAESSLRCDEVRCVG